MKQWTWETIADTLIKEFKQDMYKNGSIITSVYDYIHNYGYSDLFCENTQLTVSSLSKKERKLLNIEGYAPSLVLTCKCLSKLTNTIVEIARTIYRSDKFIFELE